MCSDAEIQQAEVELAAEGASVTPEAVQARCEVNAAASTDALPE